ncbi:hypothetical protein Q73A0000_14515 [Kaistella flava (ex Peng et al. 2021)]|uniref:Uncharacterized protein n=1 Tax=Kaistella flava (ex Peng et al. 2021) TaxID=2038776 RepID=A0A7M2YCZ0_9FLAO|nr:hypothetical protein [Kaistella flava (ex Peng et al. 2021)]QOW11494.1 hypothetical protein Q73A0000_14515 [Kaistella flava (ex Peng et al. 2021)]
MKKELLLPKTVLYTLILINLVFNFVIIFFKIPSLDISLAAGKVLIYIGLFSSFIASMVLIVDVFTNHINGRYLWTLAFLFSGGFIGFFYLRSRDYYLKSGNL